MEKPKEITVILLECVWMPNGEIIHQGKSIGFFEENKFAYKEEHDTSSHD